MSNLAISYAFSNEKDQNDQVDKIFLRSYLDPLAQALKEKKEVGEVFHSLIPEFDNRLEDEVRADSTLSSDEKYTRGLQECVDAFVENQTKAIIFILKYPLKNTKENNIEPIPSGGMMRELEYAHKHNIAKIVLLQEGLHTHKYTEEYTKNALVIVFSSLETMMDEVRGSDELQKELAKMT